MRRLSPRAIRLQLSWINGPWFDRIALRWQRSSVPRSEPLDFFSQLNSVQRVLIAPNDRVGGLFLGAPICKLVRQSYPRAHIGLLVDRTKAVIARQIPFVDEVVTASLDKAPWTGAFKKSMGELKKRDLDLLLCLGRDCSLRLAHLCGASGATLRVGFARAEIESFNIEVIGHNRDDYEVRQYLALLSAIGLEGDAKLHWSLAGDNAEKVRTRYLDSAAGRDGVVGIDLARGEGKGLARSQCDDMVGRVVASGARVLLFFSLAEKKTVNYLKETYGNRVIPFEQDDLLAAAALLESCQALIACNTELLHLAVSLQVPVVGIFAEKPERWVAADNPAVRIVKVQDPRTVDISHVVAGLDAALGERRVVAK